MNRNQQQNIANAIASNDAQQVINAIQTALIGETGKGWHHFLGKLMVFILTGTLCSTIFGRGNGKLPFWAFSSLPGVGFCAGLGACLKWCYSFRSWRYPGAFVRQCQNSWLLQSTEGRATLLKSLDDTIAKHKRTKAYKAELAKSGEAPPIDFRLYVDGDFSSSHDVAFWFNALRNRPELACYGYSKSWVEILNYARSNVVPDNYIMNLSSGSIHSSATAQRLRLIKSESGLPMVRDEFIGVKMPYKVRSSMHADRKHQKALRAEYFKQTGRKAFTCPGKCGDCTLAKHACGSRRFQDIPIIIAVH